MTTSDWSLPKLTITYRLECNHCEYTTTGYATVQECPECNYGSLYITGEVDG